MTNDVLFIQLFAIYFHAADSKCIDGVYMQFLFCTKIVAFLMD